jgi:hypothetical protein
MADGSELRAQVAADSLLQDEINRGLATLGARLSEDIDLRMVRIIARVLESSWTEHVGFQHAVVFPIVAFESRGVLGVQVAIDRLRAEHEDIKLQHAALGRALDLLLRGVIVAELPALAKRALEARSRHFDAEDCIVERLPRSYHVADLARHAEWLANRLGPRFPLGLFARRKLSERKSGLK